MIYKILTVAAMATFEIYVAIPTGFAFGLSPITIFLAAFIGGIIGVFVAAFLGQKIENYLSKFKKSNHPKKQKKPNLAHKMWDKYGIIGLGFFGTMAVGAPVSIAVGVSFNVNMHKLAMWCCFGVLVRCIVFTTIGHYGMKLF